MWSWLFEKKAEPAQSQPSLTPEEEKIFEKLSTDVKQTYQIGPKIAAGVFGTVYRVRAQLTIVFAIGLAKFILFS
jgi:hypothetical protein